MWDKGQQKCRPSKFAPAENRTRNCRRAAIHYENSRKCSLEPKMSLFLFENQLWRLLTLLLFDLQRRTVPHLKDLSNICLEPETKGHGMTFKVCSIGSNYPYIRSYRGKSAVYCEHSCRSFHWP